MLKKVSYGIFSLFIRTMILGTRAQRLLSQMWIYKEYSQNRAPLLAFKQMIS